MKVTESIWNEYHQKLYRFIQYRVTDTSITDDILQEVIMRVHSRIDTLKDQNKIQNWLYRITRNAIIDHYRAQKPMQELPETFTGPQQDAGDEARREIASCLIPFIQNLPEHYRQALTLSEIEGFTQKEVAAKQRLSLSGAKARVQRGRAMMKEMLLKCCRFEFDHQGKMIDYEAKSRNCDKC
jgi:RNA polymerase sigma-70 factor (ECF subfamily)